MISEIIKYCLVVCSEQRNSTMFTCSTVPVLDAMVLELVVVFDEVSQRTGKAFEYKENPTIHEIFPLASFARQV